MAVTKKKLGDIAIVVGGGMMLLSPATGYVRSAGPTTVGANPIVLFPSGMTLLFAGLVFRADAFDYLLSVGQRMSAFYKGLAILVLNVIVVFLCLDFAVRVIYKARDSLFSTPAAVDARANSSYYGSQPWAAQFWREFMGSRKNRYHSHVLWRRAPLKGETINVDDKGIRLTPGADCSAGSFKVFAFGGSTMWGTGAPDWGTVPAYLQSAISSLKNGPVCVVNFGESGYISTQGVIELMVQLQSGNIPDVTLFFDGTNDIYTAYQSGRPGVNENSEQLAARFERRDIPNPVIELVQLSSLHRLAVSLVTKLSPAVSSSPKLITYEALGVDAASLSNSIVQTYLSNYKIVNAMAQTHGFKSLFFWPPYIGVGAKPLTIEEVELKRGVDPALAKLYLSVYREIEPRVPEYQNLIYMGRIFDGYKPLLWLDEVHVTPVGNELIAQQMLEALKARGVF